MEEVINKPDRQFKDILNDLIDYSKDSEEKSALIEEVCRSKHSTKPAASLNSSTYSSAASSSSSTSSTLSSPSQSSQTNGENNSKRSILLNNDYDKLEVAKIEDLGKTARILEQYHQQNKLQTDLTNIDNNTNQINNNVNVISNNISITNSWKTMSGKRDKRRRKPTEQPVLSQHIPGHRGEQEVDWLVNFIEVSFRFLVIYTCRKNIKLCAACLFKHASASDPICIYMLTQQHPHSFFHSML